MPQVALVSLSRHFTSVVILTNLTVAGSKRVSGRKDVEGAKRELIRCVRAAKLHKVEAFLTTRSAKENPIGKHVFVVGFECTSEVSTTVYLSRLTHVIHDVSRHIQAHALVDTSSKIEAAVLDLAIVARAGATNEGNLILRVQLARDVASTTRIGTGFEEFQPPAREVKQSAQVHDLIILRSRHLVTCTTPAHLT